MPTAMITDEVSRQVRELLDQWASAWNAADAGAMAVLFRDDAHWVNVVGMHWIGRAAIERAHRINFDMMFRGVEQSIEAIESITPIAGGAVSVVARWFVGAFTAPDGHQNPPSRDRMSLVLAPVGDRLEIVHGANVAVLESAQRFDPIRQEPE